MISTDDAVLPWGPDPTTPTSSTWGIPTTTCRSTGKQFLMVQQSDTTSGSSGFVVVEHWFEELTRLVPTP